LLILLWTGHPQSLWPTTTLPEILTPSKEDIALTLRLINAGNILGIRLLDHVIFNKKTYFSFKEQAVIEGLN